MTLSSTMVEVPACLSLFVISLSLMTRGWKQMGGQNINKNNNRFDLSFALGVILRACARLVRDGKRLNRSHGKGHEYKIKSKNAESFWGRVSDENHP